MTITFHIHRYLFLISLIIFSTSDSFGQNVINGKVWLDYNADGNIDGFDPGLPQVPVFLITCSGQFLQSTLTDINGDYTFTNVANGDYKLFFNKSNLASNFRFTRIGLGYENSAYTNGYTSCSVINDNNTFNAGLTILSSIGDQVWEDINGNGLREPFENGIENVLINLFNDADELVAQTMTNSIGRYVFNDLFPDSYYLEFLPNPIYKATKSILAPTFSNSDITNTTGRNLTEVYDILADQTINDIDAGFYRCAELCGHIYYDENGDDLFQSNENGINNLEIQIWQVNSMDTILYSTQLTQNNPNSSSDDGYYSFCVPPGDYFLKLIIPSDADLYPGLPQIGLDPTIYNHINQSNGRNTTSTKTVTSGSSNCDINNGMSCRGAILVTLWLDENRNGIREGNEDLLNNINVILYNTDRTEIKTLSSNASGVVSFDSIPRGQYYIYCAASNQYMFTPSLATTDSDIDSDIVGRYGYGTSNTLDLSNCQKLTNIGAGIALRPLPVVWGESWVKAQERYNLIHWDVITEKNSDKYVVYKSKNGINSWEILGELKAKNNGLATNYELTDTKYYATLTYYKIVAFDYDGKTFESGILYTERGDNHYLTNLKMEIVPNPATEEINIKFNQAEDVVAYTVVIIDSNGRVIKTHKIDNNDGTLVNVSDLYNGLYNVILMHDSKTVAKQNLVIQK